MSSRGTLSSDLNTFIYGVSRRNFQNATDLAKIGIGLLKNYPAARDAVLEYFSMVFQDAVSSSGSSQLEFEGDSSSNSSLEAVNMIGPDLCNLGSTWAPFIAPWCINLLKEVASNKNNYSISTLQNLDPVRVLLDVATQNLTLLNAEERAKCIDMMLGSSQCDWVVAHLGRCEPSLVVPRALQLGLESQHGIEHAHGILSHLPSTHAPYIRSALGQLFTEAISDNSKMEKRGDIIPYLLNLASKSDVILKAITHDIESLLTEAAVEKLLKICAVIRNSPSWENVGPSLLVSLLMRADISSFMLLMRYATKIVFCRQLLEYLLQKLEYEALHPDSKIQLLSSAAEEIENVRHKLLTANQLEQYSITRILILVCHQLPDEFRNTISYLLQYSRDDRTLALLVRLISGTITMHSPSDGSDINLNANKLQNLIKVAVQYALNDALTSDYQLKEEFFEEKDMTGKKTFLHHFCLNITKLLRWENSSKVAHLRDRPIGRACDGSLLALAGALADTVSLVRVGVPGTASALPAMPVCHALALTIDQVDLSGAKGAPPPIDAIMKLVQATVVYFFRCLHETDLMDKMQGSQTACRLLRKVCLHSKLARAIALRELLETAMFREDETLGAVPMLLSTATSATPEHLIQMNQRHGPITQLSQSHTSVFHAGIIGKGTRKMAANKDAVPPAITTDIELVMAALMACMEGNGGVEEGMTSVALLLVELVSPDVMYNGLPWPDEDFTKVSIERELYMRRALECCGVARAALRRAAAARPALCYGSALLRAVAATTLHRHRAANDKYSGSAELDRERLMMGELLETMTLGQLLPHPLNYMMQILPDLTCSEVVQILRDCLWNYTRDHVPSPALFTADSSGLHWRDPATCKPPAIYTDILRIVIQKNIVKLGPMYPLMFLNLEKVTDT